MINPNVDDTILVIALKKDDLKAFEILYNRYRKVVYCSSLKYLSDVEESKELVQTVFINIWEHRSFLDELRPVKSYIYRSTANAIYNVLKKRAIRRNYVLKQLQKPEDSSNPYEQIFFRDLDERLEKTIDSFSPQQQTIYRLRNREGLSAQEIADRLNLSVRTVENQIYRVTKILKIRLRSDFPS